MSTLDEGFAQLKTEAIDLVNKATGEDRDLTPEERQGQDKRFARCDTIRSSTRLSWPTGCATRSGRSSAAGR